MLGCHLTPKEIDFQASEELAELVDITLEWVTQLHYGSRSPSSIYSPGSHGCLLLKTCKGDCQPFAQKKHT
jgi:hypothetical protein